MFFLGIAPLACICAFILHTIASILWQSFSRVGNNSNYTQIGGGIILSALGGLLSYMLLLAPETTIPSINKLQIVLSCLGFLCCYTLIRPRTMGIDHLAFIGFSIIASIALILSKNLINLFFVLEFVNMLVIYSFFLNATSAKYQTTNSALKISASCVYQFILNFFSSIILYLAINWYIGITGGSELSSAVLWQSHTSVKLPASIILAAFLLKFGSGPWIFFKVSIYKNLSYVAVFMYTAIYLLVVFVFFLNLIFISGLTPNLIAVNAIIAASAFGTIIFSNLAFQSSNLFVFLSFSSLINITVFILQALSVSSVWIAQE